MDGTESTVRIDSRPYPASRGDDRFVPLAAELRSDFEKRAARHDRENTFVEENFETMRATGYLGLAVPAELGGLGATTRQVCYAEAELARGCGATALAVSMHHHVVLTASWRWRHGAHLPEGLLRHVVNDRLVVLSTGGNDWVDPTSVAVRVDGGYLVNGRKVFCSEAPTADILSTWATYEDPDRGPVILGLSIPASTPGLTMVETWDTLGMRGTGSHDIVMSDVPVTDAQVYVVRPWKEVDPELVIAAVHAMPVISAVYWGVAAGARDEAVRRLIARHGAAIAGAHEVHRQVGLMDAELRTGWWSLLGAVNEIGDDPSPTHDGFTSVMIAKRQTVDAAIRVTDLAMDVVGGSAYFTRTPLERAFRDARAGRYHPITPEATLSYAGRTALGLSPKQL